MTALTQSRHLVVNRFAAGSSARTVQEIRGFVEPLSVVTSAQFAYGYVDLFYITSLVGDHVCEVVIDVIGTGAPIPDVVADPEWTRRYVGTTIEQTDSGRRAWHTWVSWRRKLPS